VEYATYEPDPDRDRFLQDRIFDAFSVSRLHEARLGLTYYATSFLDVSTSYSFATYDRIDDDSVNGNIWKLGFTWNFWRQIGLRAFNGVYLIDGAGRDRAVSVNCGLSEEILRGLELHAVFAFADFRSISGKDGNAFSYIAGTQYMVVRNVSLLAEVEYNVNPDFDSDVRGNFGITYSFSRS
jgi:opacity protein-like surface antigen